MSPPDIKLRIIRYVPVLDQNYLIKKNKINLSCHHVERAEQSCWVKISMVDGMTDQAKITTETTQRLLFPFMLSFASRFCIMNVGGSVSINKRQCLDLDNEVYTLLLFIGQVPLTSSAWCYISLGSVLSAFLFLLTLAILLHRHHWLNLLHPGRALMFS